jgi:type II secretory pathway component PulK
MPNQVRAHARSQQGTALVIALVLLVSVTLLSLASVTNSVLEMRMAGADEERMQVYQATDSSISLVITGFPTYVKNLADGEVRCINSSAVGGCSNGNALNSAIFGADDKLDVTLALAGADLDPIRIRDTARVDATTGERIGAMDTDSRRFEYIIEATLDRRASDQGFAHLFRGFSRQVSTPSGTVGGDFETCPAGGCS